MFKTIALHEMSENTWQIGSDYSVVKLSEGEFSWIEMLREGEFVDSNSGTKVKVTEATIDNLIRSFDEKVRGQDLDVDYEHKRDPNHGSDAAGWFGEVQKRDHEMPDGKKVKSLWMKPKSWTPEAQEDIRSGKRKYFSIEFHDWKNPETGKFFKDVLFGGALTNRPAVKYLAPVTLSEGKETAAKAQKTTKGATPMQKVKAMLASMGVMLSEDASAEVIEYAAADKIKALSEINTMQAKELTELKEKTAKGEAAIKELVEVKEKQKVKELAEMEAKKAVILDAAKKAFTPAELKDEKHYFSALLSESKFELCEQILKDKGISLKETKHLDEDEAEDEDEKGKDPSKDWEDHSSDQKHAAVQAHMKANKMDESEKSSYAKAAKACEAAHNAKYAEHLKKFREKKAGK